MLGLRPAAQVARGTAPRVPLVVPGAPRAWIAAADPKPGPDRGTRPRRGGVVGGMVGLGLGVPLECISRWNACHMGHGAKP